MNWIRSLLAIALIVFGVMLPVLSVTGGCVKHVRATEVYRAEAGFFEAAGEEAGTLLIREAARAETEEACAELAETGYVLSLRQPYHARMMLFLAGLEPDPGDPPELPSAADYCADRGDP